LKRSLRVVDESRDPPVATPTMVTVGRQLVSITDTGDGIASRRFIDALLEAGAARLDDGSGPKPDLRIVIRGAPKSPEARLRADVLEEAADLVLGADRPAFARLLALACAT
jgi:hypothetical protein